MSHERLAETFDQWAADGRDAKMEQEHGDAVRQVISRMGIVSGDKILDLGCGNGWGTRLQKVSGVTAAKDSALDPILDQVGGKQRVAIGA